MTENQLLEIRLKLIGDGRALKPGTIKQDMWKLFAELERLRAVIAWHSMISAPMDGTPILIRTRAQCGEIQAVAKWNGHAWVSIPGQWTLDVIDWQPLQEIPNGR